jgi:hypothetical protein
MFQARSHEKHGDWGAQVHIIVSHLPFSITTLPVGKLASNTIDLLVVGFASAAAAECVGFVNDASIDESVSPGATPRRNTVLIIFVGIPLAIPTDAVARREAAGHFVLKFFDESEEQKKDPVTPFEKIRYRYHSGLFFFFFFLTIYFEVLRSRFYHTIRLPAVSYFEVSVTP